FATMCLNSTAYWWGFSKVALSSTAATAAILLFERNGTRRIGHFTAAVSGRGGRVGCGDPGGRGPRQRGPLGNSDRYLGESRFSGRGSSQPGKGGEKSI